MLNVPTIARLATFARSFPAWANTTPFTYQDGLTNARLMESLISYVDKELVPFVDAEMVNVIEAWKTTVAEALDGADSAVEAVTTLATALDTSVRERLTANETAMLDAIATVVENSVELQAEVVEAIFADDDSAPRELLNGLYASASVATDVATRLSDDVMDDKYSRYRKVIKPEDYGAVGDGVTDDYAAINAAIAASDENDIVALSGKYACSYPVMVQGKTRLTISGGHIIFTHTGSPNKGGTAVIIEDSRGCLFENITLEQSAATQHLEYSGVTARNSVNCDFVNVTAFNFRWVGMGAVGGSTHITFKDCKGLQCYVGGYSDATTEHITFSGGRYSSEWSTTQEFQDNGGVWIPGSKYYDGIIISGKYWLIDGVTLDDNGQSGVFGDAGNIGGTISNCSINRNWNKGIDFGKTIAGEIKMLSIVGNVVTDNQTGDIHLAIANQCSIVGNIVSTSGSFAIGLNGLCTFNTVANNVINSIVAHPAIFADSMTVNNVFANNTINAPTPYSVPPGTNVIERATQSQKIVEAMFTIDRRSADGYMGRALLNLFASADNDAIQLSANKPVHFNTPEGAFQDIRVGDTITESVYVAGTGFLTLPTSPQSGAGMLWFDASDNKLKFSDGASVHTVTSV